MGETLFSLHHCRSSSHIILAIRVMIVPFDMLHLVSGINSPYTCSCGYSHHPCCPSYAMRVATDRNRFFARLCA